VTTRVCRWPYHKRNNPLIGILALAVLFMGACSDESSVGPQSSQITLKVRVHLLQSTEFAPLNSTLADSEVLQLFAGANAIWERAGVTWQVESIVRVEVLNAAGYASILRGEIPATGPAIASVLPLENAAPDEWDVFLLRDFGGLVGGVYLSPFSSVVAAELDPAGQRDLSGSAARILAHELGHSLTLQHVTCTADGNLMSPGCATGDRSLLTSGQIDLARVQANTGRPSLF
jgi:hypothetical protein